MCFRTYLIEQRSGKDTCATCLIHAKPMEQNYTRELSRATTGTFRLNIPSQRYPPKRPYARPRNGRAINYITARFRKYVKVDLHAVARINRAVANKSGAQV